MKNTLLLLMGILFCVYTNAQVNCGSNIFPCSGSVGIGTNSPTYKLDVDGTIYTLRIGQSSVSYFGVQNFTNSVQLGTLDASDLDIMINGGSVGRITHANNSRFAFGHTSPETKFHIYGVETNTTLGSSTNAAIRIQNNEGASFGQLAELQFQNNSSNTPNAVIASSYSSYSTTTGSPQWGSHLIFGTKSHLNTSVQERMRLTEDGKLGIGTTSPQTKLDLSGVFGQSSTTYLSSHTPGSNRMASFAVNSYWDGSGYIVPDNTQPGAAFELHRGASIARILSIATSGVSTTDHQFGLDGGNSFLNSQGGSLGIGTTSPTRNGGSFGKIVDLSGSGNVGYIMKSGGQESSILNSGTGVYFDVIGASTASNNFISFRTSNTNSNNTASIEAMRIKSDGAVMIGGGFSNTYDSRYKLLVEGTIGASEVYVTLTRPWPDYVFGSNYKLLSLEQLDAYIQQNKHLPNMPSAEAMKKDGGVNLGEMNAKLLEKVEELTLYVLELKKEINEIKGQKK